MDKLYYNLIRMIVLINQKIMLINILMLNKIILIIVVFIYYGIKWVNNEKINKN